jgi:cytoskeletal protein CcmA (bactofilin family)
MELKTIFGGKNMWKKPFNDKKETTTMNSVAEPVAASTGKETALVGPSIVITGGLSGEEDVVIQGRVEGTIDFRKNSVTIGKHGRVKADVNAREICVEGDLDGNMVASEKVQIRATGKVRGNIEAPRVIMEDGALFKGSVDMDVRAKAKTDTTHKEALTAMPAGAKLDKTTADASNLATKKTAGF